MAYYSVLIKHDPVRNNVKEVYRIKLPGNPVLGEGKPENQNHAIVFTRGRYIQAIDMNQDGYFEESLKMRNVLQEFDSGCAIVGFREHIFTGSVSSVANYMALQELSFVTLGQRVLANPLRIRQHYGHPDFFDKIFVMTEGGMSKASKGINLSEDVFAGFNATIRGHTVSFKEYAQVGKGRDVGLQQTYKFEAKLSQGNAEQALSRDLFRICDRLDFFRLCSFFWGGIGHYISNTLVMFTLVLVVYTMLGLAIYSEEGVNGRPMHPEGVLQLLLSGLGLLQTLPLFITLTVEKGLLSAISEIAFMFLSGGPLYFIFHIQTKAYYFQQTLLAGGAMYRPTGRGFVIRHSPFDENFRFFVSSHIYLGIELMVALILFYAYTTSKQYSGLTWSLWLTVASFLMGPFWFNPVTFEINKVKEDYILWINWMTETGGTGEQSWECWWREENSFYSGLSLSWKVFLFVQKSCIWLFISYGLAGARLRHDSGIYSCNYYILFIYHHHHHHHHHCR
jgi:callose synthase